VAFDNLGRLYISAGGGSSLVGGLEAEAEAEGGEGVVEEVEEEVAVGVVGVVVVML